MDITIREATLNDLEKIQELNLKLFEKEYEEYDKLLDLNWSFGKVGTKYFKDHISKDDCFVVVALIDDEIVGYLCGGLTKAEIYRKLPLTAEVENTFVIEKYRSKGVGTKLYNNFLEWCKKKKVGKIRVQATAQNEKAINLYRRNGFKDYTLILECDL